MESAKNLDSFLNRRGYFRVQIVEEESPRDANAQPGRKLGDGGHEIRNGRVHAGWISRIVAREYLQHERRIVHGVSDRAHVIVRVGQRHHAARAHPAVGRLESDHSTVVSGLTNGTGGVGADRRETQPGGNTRRRASRGASSQTLHIPRVVDLAKETDHGAATVGKLVQVLLAYNDCAGRTQAADDFGVFRGNAVFEEFAGGGGADAGGIDDVFESDGNAVQRAAVVATLDLLLGAAGLIEG